MEGIKELQNSVSILTKEVFDLKKKSSLEDIILNAEYKVLGFSGYADGSLLDHEFDDNMVYNKNILIKGIQFFPYYSVDSTDIELTDGVTTTSERVPAFFRMNRVFDSFTTTPTGVCKIIINGKSEIFDFSSLAFQGGKIPPDFAIDNIYYRVKQKLSSIDMQMLLQYLQLFPTPGTVATVLLKVYIECYIF